MTNTLRLYASPYDQSAMGWFFDTLEEYKSKFSKHVNAYGQPVEEYQIDIADGKGLEIALFNAVKPSHSATLEAYLEAVETWSDDEILRACIIYGEHLNSCQFDEYTTSDGDDLDIYEPEGWQDPMTWLAEQFVDEGLLGEIPEHLQHYIDYEAYGRDLSVDYSTCEIAGTTYIYRMA